MHHFRLLLGSLVIGMVEAQVLPQRGALLVVPVTRTHRTHTEALGYPRQRRVRRRCRHQTVVLVGFQALGLLGSLLGAAGVVDSCAGISQF